MTRTSTIGIRIEAETWRLAAVALEPMGLTIQDAMRMFLRRVAETGRLPFAVDVPNARTRAAMEEARLMSVRMASAAGAGSD